MSLMSTPAELEAAVGAEAAAESTFGNMEAVTSTLFTPTKPTNPTQPDFISEGKVIDGQAIAMATPFSSKAVRVTDKSGNSTKTVYVESDSAGSFVVEVMLDESELSGGDAVWRGISGSSPIAFGAGALAYFTFFEIARQVRVTVTTSADSSATNAWVFSSH